MPFLCSVNYTPTFTEPEAVTLEFSSKVADYSATEGDKDVRLSCKLSEKNDKVEIVWYKHNKVSIQYEGVWLTGPGSLLSDCCESSSVGGE